LYAGDGDLTENMAKAMRLRGILEASFCVCRLTSNCRLPRLRRMPIEDQFHEMTTKKAHLAVSYFRGDLTENRTPIARMKTWCPNR
jgi:hypothetical protein